MVTQPSLQSDFMSCISAALSLWSLQTHTHMSLCYTTSLQYATVISQAKNIVLKEGGYKCSCFLLWFCNGCLQKIVLKCVYLKSWLQIYVFFSTCVLSNVLYNVACECTCESCARSHRGVHVSVFSISFTDLLREELSRWAGFVQL